MYFTVKNILFLIVVLLTNAIQAITGFAGTLLAMPPSILLIGVDTAKIILNFLAFITCLVIVIQGRKMVQWKILIRILVFMAIGMFIGVAVFKVIKLQFLLYGYGLLIVAIALVKLKGEKERSYPQPLLMGILLAAGIIHGMFVSGGALLVVYAALVLKNKDHFRATVACVWVILNPILMLTQLTPAMVQGNVAVFTLIACVPAFIGVYIGNRLHAKISQKLFMKITYVLLLISGILCFI